MIYVVRIRHLGILNLCIIDWSYMCIHVRAMSHGKPSTKAPAPAKATVQRCSIHDDGIFNVVAAVTSGAYEDVWSMCWSPCQHLAFLSQPQWSTVSTPSLVRNASEMLITATEAFCPAPRWWKFTRFLPGVIPCGWWSTLMPEKSGILKNS